MVSRRLLLASGGTILAASIAGCTDILGSGDNPEDANQTGNGNQSANGDSASTDGNGDSTLPDVTFSDWLAADIVDDEWEVDVMMPARRVAITGISNPIFEDFESLDESDIDLQVDLVDSGDGILPRTVSVQIGSFDMQSMISFQETLNADNELTEKGSYQDYQLYTAPLGVNEGRVGVKEGITITAPDRESLEATVDAHNGQATRLQETDPRFERLLSTVSVTHDLVFEATEPYAGGAIAFGSDYVSDRAEFELATDHRSEQGAMELAEVIEAELTDTDFMDTSVSVDGELVYMTAAKSVHGYDIYSPGDPIPDTVRNAVATGEPGSNQSQVPWARFDFEYSEATRNLTIRHGDGPQLTAGNVIITGSGTSDVESTWAELSTSQNITAESQIGPESTIQLKDVGSDFEVDLVWNNESSSVTIAEYTRQAP